MDLFGWFVLSFPLKPKLQGSLHELFTAVPSRTRYQANRTRSMNE